jgi:hypothetical protein
MPTITPNSINAKDIWVYANVYAENGADYWPVVCQLNATLTLNKEEVDATSKCGQEFLQGNDDNSFEITINAQKLPLPTDSFSLDNLFAWQQAGTLVNWKIVDDIDTPVNYGRSFAGRVFGITEDAPTSGAMTGAATIRPTGAITNLLAP